MNNDEKLIINNYCSSDSIEFFNKSLPPNNISNFFVFYQNIRSLDHNIDDEFIVISDLNIIPDLIILSETFSNNRHCHDLLGYRGYHSYRTDNGRGGVSVYVLKNYVSDYDLHLSWITDLIEICTQ